MGRTLHRYVFLQVLGPFAAGLALFTFILLIARIMKLVELVVNRGVPLGQVLLLFSYILPAFLEVTVPMALLLAILMAIGRMSADSELIALRASGLSLYQITVPIAVFAVVIFAASMALSLHARAWGNARLKTGVFELARTRATAGLTENVFNDDFAGLVIYVEEIEPPGTELRRILISDRRVPDQENTVIASRGTLVADENAQTLHLRLQDGVTFTNDAAEREFHKTDFVEYDVSLDLTEALGQLETRERSANEIPLAELRAIIDERTASGESTVTERIELARRHAIPFAALIFPLLAVPLGLQPVRAVRSRGLAVSLVIILVYYLLLTGGDALAANQILPVQVSIWMPNLVLFTAGVLLFLRAAREARPPFEGKGRALVEMIRTRLIPTRSGAA